MDLSQRDILAISNGADVEMWKNPFDANNFELYMKHTASGYEKDKRKRREKQRRKK